MLTFAIGLLNLAWKTLLLVAVVTLMRTICKNGKDFVRDLGETIGMAVRVANQKVKEWLWKKYNETGEEPKKET